MKSEKLNISGWERKNIAKLLVNLEVGKKSYWGEWYNILFIKSYILIWGF